MRQTARRGRGKLICMEHPTVIRPADHADWRSDKMGKTTLFQSPRLLVGLNAFEPGQSHALHTHPGMDKVYKSSRATACSCSTDGNCR